MPLAGKHNMSRRGRLCQSERAADLDLHGEFGVFLQADLGIEAGDDSRRSCKSEASRIHTLEVVGRGRTLCQGGRAQSQMGGVSRVINGGHGALAVILSGGDEPGDAVSVVGGGYINSVGFEAGEVDALDLADRGEGAGRRMWFQAGRAADQLK